MAADPDPVHHDLNDPQYYLNRELTWLEFNSRVLHEGVDPRTPLLERVKFLSIASSNLDEFFMKRIGGLKLQVAAGVMDKTVDGRSPEQQIDESLAVVRRQEAQLQEALLGVLLDLSHAGIKLVGYQDLSRKKQLKLRDHFFNTIYPLVTPQATDPAHPFPFISNLSLNLLVSLKYPENATPALARVKVPVGGGVPRFMRIAGESVYVALEDVMANNLDLLFPDMDIDSVSLFRVTRNANTERDEEKADDLLSLIESELRDRRMAPIVRLEVQSGMAPVHRGLLAAELELDEHRDVMEVEGMLGIRDVMELVQDNPDRTDLLDPTHHPLDNPAFTSERNIFHTLRDEKSLLVSHPYESFSTSVGRFLREASTDPKVRAIKMSLYRTSADSNVVDHLLNAAKNGKQVAVVVELKARFDEAANIHWANRLEEAGVHVTYGVLGLKTHCKVILVVRQDYDTLRRYVHIGTGNYHAGTARIYSDLGLFVAKKSIGQDATELFNYLTTGYKPKRRYKKMLPAPKILKAELLAKISREVEKHTPEDPGLIRFKVNALEDVDVTRALYEAGQAGVHVELVVRDSCRLRPGIPGLSDTITVVSIVGRFLEHARVFYFRNGGDEEYYIGSADIMSRNLESRVEVMIPVENKAARRYLQRMLELQVQDHRQGWVMQPDGTYVQRMPQNQAQETGSQALLAREAETRLKESLRLRKRPLKGMKRNLR